MLFYKVDVSIKSGGLSLTSHQEDALLHINYDSSVCDRVGKVDLQFCPLITNSLERSLLLRCPGGPKTSTRRDLLKQQLQGQAFSELQYCHFACYGLYSWGRKDGSG